MFVTYSPLLLILVSLTKAQIDTSSCANFSSNIEKCNTDFLPSARFNSDKEIISAFLSDPTQVCGTEREGIQSTGECIVNTIKACGTGQYLDLYTTPSKFIEALDFACNIRDKFDPACLNQVEYLLCVNTRAVAVNLTKAPVGADFQRTRDYYCSHEDFKMKCLEWNSGLDTCSKPDTKSIHVEIESRIGAEHCRSSAISLSLTSGLVMAASRVAYIFFTLY